MIFKKIARSLPKNLLRSRPVFSFCNKIQNENEDTELALDETLQFSKEGLSDFGELPFGEIPDSLHFDRANSFT